MPNPKYGEFAHVRIDALVREGSKLAMAYADSIGDQRTATLRRLAEVIVDLRSMFALTDGRTDWGGRTPQYRTAYRDIFTRAGQEKGLRPLQSALRYHVGNRLRDVAPAHELERVGLRQASPKDHLRESRAIAAALVSSRVRSEDILPTVTALRGVLSSIRPEQVTQMTPGESNEAMLQLGGIAGMAWQLARAMD